MKKYMIKVTVETDNGSVTRHYAEDYKDTIAWYDEVLEMIEINDKHDYE